MRDYLGNTITRTIGEFGLNMIGSMMCSVTGDTIGVLISGDINSWKSFGQTAALSIEMSIFSSGISSGISSAVSNAFGTAQYKKLEESLPRILKLIIILKVLKVQKL